MRRRLVAFFFPVAIVSAALADSPATQPSTHKAATTQPTTLFDPARHMKVSEVHAGMKGYGLTVLSGTKITRFDVEVINTLHNSFGPQQDVVMIRCLDAFMEHTGPIAGCSGSPIYLYDESGKARLIGAYAFGFNTAKDPIIGVQPIEYMMQLVKPPANVDDTGTKPVAGVPQTWSMLSSPSWRASLRDQSRLPKLQDETPAELETTSASPLGFHPLAVPLAVRGADESTLAALRPGLRQQGFEPLLAPGTTAPTTDASPVIEPGSVMGAAIMSGDLELAALGTCTDVVDGRAFGFGHPFNGEGVTSIPMGPGAVTLVMPLLTNSFKMGGLTSITGAIDMDGSSGIAGQISNLAKTVPIDVEVQEGEAPPRQFHYRAALHRTFTPQMVTTALGNSLVAAHELPVEFTASYSVVLKFAGGREITLNNRTTSLDGFDFGRDAVWPVSTAMDNPYGNVMPESVTAKVTVERGVRAAMIESATVAQSVYKPGETARVNIRLRKYKGEAFTQSIDIPLPATLKDGDYAVSISDASTSLGEDATARPDEFAVRNIDELFATMTKLSKSARNDALYARLTGTEGGVAIGRTQLPKLPPSRRAALAEAGRPDVAPTADVTLTIVPMPVTITGSAAATIHVKKKLP